MEKSGIGRVGGVGGQTPNGKSLNLFFPYFLDEFPKRQGINSNPILGLSENAFHCLKLLSGKSSEGKKLLKPP